VQRRCSIGLQRNSPTGEDRTVSAYAFGDALPSIEADALGNETTTLVDELGRVTERIDPNRVSYRFSYDAFGRVTQETVEGVGGTETPTVTRSYSDAAPSVVQEDRLDAFGSLAGRTVQVADGHGNQRESWELRDAATDAWVVSTSLVDAFGNLRFTTVPEMRTGLFSSSPGGTQLLTANASDAFGEVRVSYRDLLASPGCFTKVYHESPRETVSLDESGRTKVTVTDAYGRLVEVRERFDNGGTQAETCGNHPYNNPSTVVSSYQWSGRSQLQKLTDAEDVDGSRDSWWYDYDMAGRLREVTRAAGTDPRSSYAAYDYDGSRPSVMYRGAPSASTRSVMWNYDALGRVVEKRVRQAGGANNPGTWPSWRATWDTQWIGAVTEETSAVIAGVPEAVTTYSYDGATEGQVGNLGRVSGVTRNFRDGTTATFRYVRDLQGEARQTVFPSGSTLTRAENDAGIVSEMEVFVPGAGTESFSVLYDSMGLAAGFDAKHVGHRLDVRRTSPSALHGLRWKTPTGAQYTIDYAHQADSRLTLKTFGGAFDSILPVPNASQHFGYDELGRLSSLSGDFGAETWTYDIMGNLEFHSRTGTAEDEEWHYSFPRPLNEPGYRSSASGAIEDSVVHPTTGHVLHYSRDDLPGIPGGLQSNWDYEYDGAGRLTQTWAQLAGQSTTGLAVGYGLEDSIITKHEVTETGVTVKSQQYLDGWQREIDGAGNVRVVESLLPALRVVGTGTTSGQMSLERKWLMREPDAHVAISFNDAGQVMGAEVLGAFDSPLYAYGKSDEEDGIHGMERDEDYDLVAMGVRHVNTRNGTWLQPEPLLHLGPPEALLGTPRQLFGSYAMGEPANLSDRTGYTPETVVDVLVLAWDVGRVGYNAYNGDWKGAGDALKDVGSDVVSLAPGVPNVRAVRAGKKLLDKAADFVGLGKKTTTVVDGGHDAVRVADNVGGATTGAKRVSGVPEKGSITPHPDAGPYKRPSAAGPTAAQKRSVQGKPCVDCGAVTPKQVADHKDPLVVQHYRDGEVDIPQQRTLEAVQPHCPSCSSTQGGHLGAFGKEMKKAVLERAQE
jgi:YD repeat-containing protein